MTGPDIEVVLDAPKREVRLNRLLIDQALPTGRVRHVLAHPYVVSWTKIPKLNPNGITSFKVSGWSDGIGVRLEISLGVFRSGASNGTVNLTSQHEETTLFYSAQQLKVEQE